MIDSSTIPSTPSDRFLYVRIFFGHLIVLLFFSADEILGAIGLRAWYNPVGMVAAAACLSLIPFVLFYRQFSRQGLFFYLAFAAVLMLAAFWLRLPLAVIGWLTGMVTGAVWIPTSIIALVFAGLLVVQFLLARRGTENAISTARFSTLITLLYCVGYFIGFAATPRYAESEISDRRTHSGHQYFLYQWYGWLGDPDYLALYECNPIGLFCEVSYRAPTGYYRGRQLSIEIDPQTQQVGAKIDDLFSPLELTEAEVAYLCAFFDAPDEDSFCADPVFQDYSSFWWMLRRNVADELNYNNIVPYFERTATFTETTCPPPDIVLSDEHPVFTCHLQFPESELVLEFSMHKSSYSGDLWYLVDLVNPNCNCE